uniref:Bifunctional NAD(P)H-hydrate repair enzyme n=1 Tax=Desulfatirhabdium butyrativorans TaxID=340467 RepID=A0A7C4MTM2_9BACT
MKRYLVTADEMRRMDRVTIEEFGIPGLVLMENAGRQAADILLETFSSRASIDVGVAAGRGNNGGDGFVIARVLASRGCSVTVYVLSSRERITGDALENLALIEAMDIEILWLASEADLLRAEVRMSAHDVLVDALLGTGLNQEVRGLYRMAIDILNRSKKPIFSVDLPSGLDADTGKPLGCCVQAHTTVTFAFPKIGHLLMPGSVYTGHLHVVDIGIPPMVADRVPSRHAWLGIRDFSDVARIRHPETHKGKTGHCLLVAGSRGKAGAAGLAGRGALRAGAGLLTLACPASIQPVLHGFLMEAMTEALPETPDGALDADALRFLLKLAAGKAVLALGPGIGQSEPTVRLVRELVVECPIPLVIDADALNALAGDPSILRRAKHPPVLTPHPGEMARLVGVSVPDIQGDRIGHARKLAEEYGCYVILKGARSLVALPDGFVYVNTTGNPGMAAAGMGDVLTGMVAGFMAQGYGQQTSCAAAVYLHGLCGDRLARDRGPRGFLASELADVLPALFLELESERS